MNGSILQLICSRIFVLDTVLTSPKKGEKAVHGCDPILSVSVVLVSRKVNVFLSSISAFSFACILHSIAVLAAELPKLIKVNQLTAIVNFGEVPTKS